MVCENAGASWLPFREFTTLCRGLNKDDGSREVIWTKGCEEQVALFG